jgi:hypothetical protein
MITKQQAWIAAGVAAAVVGFAYLATRREVHATVTEGEPSLTYRVGGGGAAGAPSAQERPTNGHNEVLDAIELSTEAIQSYNVPANPWGIS